MLVRRGRRLTDLSAIDLLDFTYSCLVENATAEDRKKIDASLAGRLGPHGGFIVDDPDLPEELQGQEAPTWWDPDHNPLQDTHDLSNVTTSRG